MSDVTCAQCREALSARLDGEDTGMTVDALSAHLAGCPSCRELAARLEALHDLMPREQMAVPDRAGDVLAAVRPRRSPRTPSPPPVRVARGALAAVALLQVLVVVAGLSPGAAPHLLRDLGAFQIALAVGFLVAALRPATAVGLLPTAIALALCLVVLVGIDVISGRVPVAGEAAHMTELLGVALVWLIARDRPVGRVQRA